MKTLACICLFGWFAVFVLVRSLTQFYKKNILWHFYCEVYISCFRTAKNLPLFLKITCERELAIRQFFDLSHLKRKKKSVLIFGGTFFIF